MKGTRTGIVTILVLLAGFPMVIDLVMLTVVPREKAFFSLTTFIVFGCLKAFPFYLIYLLFKRIINRILNEFYKLM